MTDQASARPNVTPTRKAAALPSPDWGLALEEVEIQDHIMSPPAPILEEVSLILFSFQFLG